MDTNVESGALGQEALTDLFRPGDPAAGLVRLLGRLGVATAPLLAHELQTSAAEIMASVQGLDDRGLIARLPQDNPNTEGDDELLALTPRGHAANATLRFYGTANALGDLLSFALGRLRLGAGASELAQQLVREQRLALDEASDLSTAVVSALLFHELLVRQGERFYLVAQDRTADIDLALLGEDFRALDDAGALDSSVRPL